MNVFVLDADPSVAAAAQHDKHVVKMVLESAQLLCGPLPGAPYRPTHLAHPCAAWTRASRGNYLWLVDHARALAEEYTRRYGRVHASTAVIEWCAQRTGAIPDGSLQPHAQAMPARYRGPCAVTAYRRYYVAEKLSGAHWTRREPPAWLVSHLIQPARQSIRPA